MQRSYQQICRVLSARRSKHRARQLIIPKGCTDFLELYGEMTEEVLSVCAAHR